MLQQLFLYIDGLSDLGFLGWLLVFVLFVFVLIALDARRASVDPGMRDAPWERQPKTLDGKVVPRPRRLRALK